MVEETDINSAKHTPGPWRVHEEHTGSPEFSTWWRIDSGTRFHMAKLEAFDIVSSASEDSKREHEITIEEVRANARLIGVAPDLLDIVQRLVNIAPATSGATAELVACEVEILQAEAKALFKKDTPSTQEKTA